MRSLAFFLLFSLVTNVFFVNIQAVIGDQLEVELLEQKTDDTENELEEELKFNEASLVSNSQYLPADILHNHNALNQFNWLASDVSTPPPEM